MALSTLARAARLPHDLDAGEAVDPPDPAKRPSIWPIVLAGLVLEALLIASFVPAPLIPQTADSGMDELLPWLEILGRPLHERLALLAPRIGLQHLAIALQLACFMGLFLPYAGVLRLVRSRSDAAIGRAILGFGVLFMLTGLCSRRLFSTDLFSYVLNGRIMVVYGGNPYLDVPARFPEDPYVPLVDWREVPNHYGPLWTFASAALSWLGGEQLGLTLFLFRLVPAVAAIVAAILIWRLLRRWRPEQAALGTALWAWNPLVILESAGSGHNDAVLALLLILAVVGLVHRRPVLGILAIAAGVLVKYSAAVLAPLYAVVLLRRARTRADRRRVVLGGAVAGVLAALSFLPFWTGDGTLPASVYVSSPARYYNSPTEMLFAQIRRWLGEGGRLVVERVEFRPWWGVARVSTDLYLERGRIPIGRIEEHRVVLATDRQVGEWQRVYDPLSRTAGYVALSALRSTTRPADLAADPEVAAYERAPAGSAVANQVNLAIRGVGWLVVLGTLLGLMYAAATADQLVRGWLILLTLVYWLVATWFFPWYLIWGLAVAALRPRGPLVWSLVVWSAAVLLYYGLAPLERDEALEWLYQWRVVPMFLPPLLVLAWWQLRRVGSRRWTAGSRQPSAGGP